MTRRPNDREPEPPGGRAAERLREFVEQRFPGETPPMDQPALESTEEAAAADAEQADDTSGETSEADDREERPPDVKNQT